MQLDNKLRTQGWVPHDLGLYIDVVLRWQVWHAGQNLAYFLQMSSAHMTCVK